MNVETTGSGPAIELENVSKLYGNSWPALTDVSLRVEKGDFVFVLGATGAGKTTMLRLLYGAEPADSGEIFVLGHDLRRIAPRDMPALRKRIGIVFQDFKLLPDRTSYENLEFVLRSIGMKPDLIPQRIQETMTQLGIMHRRNTRARELSGGEQQKVSIARALAKEPELLLADEPTGNIDPKASADVLNLLKDANYRGTTVIMCTHDAELARGSHRRAVTLDAGRIVRDAE